MNIAIIGNDYFGTKLAKQLKNVNKEHRYSYYDTNAKLTEKIRFALALPFVDIVYSLSATVRGGGALSLALKLNKKIIQHFIGSDVLTSQEEYKNENVNWHLVKNSRFFCEVNWIQEELAQIEIDAKIVPIMAYENFTKPVEIDNFSILTYLGKGKEKYYGIDDFIKLAKEFKEIKFKIAGIDSYENLPPNIECLGWTNLKEELQKTAVYIRNAKHDGLAFSVIEALAEGRYVAMNYEFDYCDYFRNFEDLKDIVLKRYQAYQNDKLDINIEAVKFVKNEFNKERVLTNLINNLVK